MTGCEEKLNAPVAESVVVSVGHDDLPALAGVVARQLARGVSTNLVRREFAIAKARRAAKESCKARERRTRSADRGLLGTARRSSSLDDARPDGCGFNRMTVDSTPSGGDRVTTSATGTEPGRTVGPTTEFSLLF